MYSTYMFITVFTNIVYHKKPYFERESITDILYQAITVHLGHKMPAWQEWHDQEENVLFNDPLNRLYLQLYDTGHVVDRPLG